MLLQLQVGCNFEKNKVRIKTGKEILVSWKCFRKDFSWNVKFKNKNQFFTAICSLLFFIQKIIPIIITAEAMVVSQFGASTLSISIVVMLL